MTQRFPNLAEERPRAFTLIEIVIAIAVTSFSIVAIIGLIPVGANAAMASRRETRAAYLADQIVSDLRASPYANANVLYQNSSGTLTPLTPFALGIPSTNWVACDAADNVLSTSLNAAQYSSGINVANADYLVQIIVLPVDFTTNLSTVSVEVSTPAQGALATRARYGFQTMIGSRQ